MPHLEKVEAQRTDVADVASDDLMPLLDDSDCVHLLDIVCDAVMTGQPLDELEGTDGTQTKWMKRCVPGATWWSSRGVRSTD